MLKSLSKFLHNINISFSFHSQKLSKISLISHYELKTEKYKTSMKLKSDIDIML
jgi:hypothetical protein